MRSREGRKGVRLFPLEKNLLLRRGGVFFCTLSCTGLIKIKKGLGY